MNNLSSLLFSSPSPSPSTLSVHANKKMFKNVKLTFKMHNNPAAVAEKQFIASTAMPANDISLEDLLNSMERLDMERLDSTVEPNIKTFLLCFNSHIDCDPKMVMQHFFERIIVFLKNEKDIWTQNIDNHAVLCEIKVSGMDLKKLIKYENHRFSNNPGSEEPIPSLVTYFNSLISPQPLLNRKVIACIGFILGSIATCVASRYGNPFLPWGSIPEHVPEPVPESVLPLGSIPEHVPESVIDGFISKLNDPFIFHDKGNTFIKWDDTQCALRGSFFYNLVHPNTKRYSLAQCKNVSSYTHKPLSRDERRRDSFVSITWKIVEEQELKLQKFKSIIQFTDLGTRKERLDIKFYQRVEKRNEIEKNKKNKTELLKDKVKFERSYQSSDCLSVKSIRECSPDERDCILTEKT